MNPNANMINTFLSMLNNGGNPEALAKTMLRNNPQARQLLEMAKGQAGNMSPKDFVMNMAKQNGVDPELVMQTARKFGIK